MEHVWPNTQKIFFKSHVFCPGTIQAEFLTGGTCTLPRWPLLERHFWQCQQHTNFSTLLPAVPIYRKEARTCARAVAPIHDLFITLTYLMGLLEHTIFQPNPFSVPEIWNRDARLRASRFATKMSYAKRLAVECLSTYQIRAQSAEPARGWSRPNTSDNPSRGTRHVPCWAPKDPTLVKYGIEGMLSFSKEDYSYNGYTTSEILRD